MQPSNLAARGIQISRDWSWCSRWECDSGLRSRIMHTVFRRSVRVERDLENAN